MTQKTWRKTWVVRGNTVTVVWPPDARRPKVTVKRRKKQRKKT